MEKTVQLFMARDCGAALEIHGNTVELETYRKEDDGIFPTEESWREFADKVDDMGIYFLGEELADGETITVQDHYITYHFPEGIQVVTGFKIENGYKSDVISTVTKIKFRMAYNWYWTNGSRESADMLELEGEYISCE